MYTVQRISRLSSAQRASRARHVRFTYKSHVVDDIEEVDNVVDRKRGSRVVDQVPSDVLMDVGRYVVECIDIHTCGDRIILRRCALRLQQDSITSRELL